MDEKNEKSTANASKDMISNLKLNSSDLNYQIDVLRKENHKLKQEISDLKAEKKDELLIPENNGKENIISNLVELNSIPSEKINDKMMDLMEERDDAVIRLKELEKEKDEAVFQKQSLELEMSGIKVEIEGLKDSFNKERIRADNAVALAERAVKTLKKKK